MFKPTTRSNSAVLGILVLLAMLSIIAYLVIRTALFFVAPFQWQERLLATFLLAAEVFILIHGFGYFLNIYHVLQKPQAPLPMATEHQLDSYPPVAIIVSSYKEPLAVVENTLTCFYNLTYPNKRLYFLDDTRYDLAWDTPERMQAYRAGIDSLCEEIGINLFRRKWHGAKAGMINDFLDFLAGNQREGFGFVPHGAKGSGETEKYIIVFDADMNPFPDFVEPLVAMMEKNPRLAFVQTPQYYSNFETNRVARASGLQQAVFYEYICEGKSLQDAMFCCGTNVIFRREALMDVGGFDETSVTEDFATSLKFHMKGWRSTYLNKVCAFGMGPEDLGGYFRQQFRWALGTVGLFRSILGELGKDPRRLSVGKWWEYFLSGTHYFVGWVFLILAACPILYLFTGVPSFFVYPEIYLLVFTPYLVLSLSIFLGTLEQRHYRPWQMFQGMFLNAICFPVYMQASLLGILGVRGSFGITPKGESHALPLLRLWPQLLTALIAFAAMVWGLHRLYYEQKPFFAILANTLWCFYHFAILSWVLYFNHPEEEE